MVGVKDALAKGLKAFAHGMKVIGFSLAASMELNRKRGELKRALLHRFTSRQLDEIGVRLGISLRNARTKSAKISALSSHLSFEDVVELARRYKVRYKDIVDELDKFKARLESRLSTVKAESKVEEIIKAVSEFRPEPIYNENDLEKQLYQFLKAKFPNIPIRRQVKLGGDLQVDIMAGPCGIELKVPKSRNQLQRLIGQVRDYSEYLECVITLILDTGTVKDLNTYVDRLINMGIIPVVVRGELRKHGKTSTTQAAPTSITYPPPPPPPPPATTHQKQTTKRHGTPRKTTHHRRHRPQRKTRKPRKKTHRQPLRRRRKGRKKK